MVIVPTDDHTIIDHFVSLFSVFSMQAAPRTGRAIRQGRIERGGVKQRTRGGGW